MESDLHIPVDEISVPATAHPRDAILVTVCGKVGGRSDRAARLLHEIGFLRVGSMCGGTAAWMRQMETMHGPVTM